MAETLRALPDPESLTAELLGGRIPRERRVVGRAMHVAMEPLDRIRLQHGARATGLEQPVHGSHAEPRDKGLVAAIAGAIHLRERQAPRGLVEHLADVVPMERPG